MDRPEVVLSDPAGGAATSGGAGTAALVVVSRCPPEPHEDTATLQAAKIAVMRIVPTTAGTRDSDCEVQLFEVMTA